ncbi:hypothetical protein V1511DRAFT_500719 [Dipodascopsis uninucleata]
MTPLQSFDPATAANILRAARFPKAGEHNDPNLIAYAESSVAAWTKRGGSDRVQARALADFLFKASAKTYHSQQILRCLMRVLAGLGNYVDATRALESYLDIAAKGRVRAEKGSVFVDIDNELVIVEVTSEGIMMIIKRLKDHEKAAKLSATLKEWISISESKTGSVSLVAVNELQNGRSSNGHTNGFSVTENSKDAILSNGWSAIGATYMFVAQGALNRRKRDQAITASQEAFEKAVTLNESNIEALYMFSILSGFLMKDVDLALSIAERALALGSNHLGVSHVLALLLSTRQEYEKAMSVCEKAVYGLLGDSRRRLSLEEKRMVIQLRLSEVALVEAMDGVEAALNIVSESVFNAYNDLFTWDEDTVESQIHEASTSAIAFPKSANNSTNDLEKISDSEKKRSAVAPIAQAPIITTLSNESNLSMADSSNLVTPSNEQASSKIVVDKISQDLIAPSNLSPEILSSLDTGAKSPGPRSLLSKKSLIFPKSLRRRLSDASTMSRRSTTSKQFVTAASIIERNKGGANRVLRNSMSTDDAELKEVSMMCLREIWLNLAGLFRRYDKWSESATSIGEATRMGGAKEDTFTERGFLMQAQGQMADAIEAFEAALTVSIDYHPAIVGLSNILLNLPDKEQPMARDRACVLLESCTNLEGWDCTEAWMLLGTAYESIGADLHVREALRRAIELEETRPIRRWQSAWMWDTI